MKFTSTAALTISVTAGLILQAHSYSTEGYYGGVERRDYIDDLLSRELSSFDRLSALTARQALEDELDELSSRYYSAIASYLARSPMDKENYSPFPYSPPRLLDVVLGPGPEISVIVNDEALATTTGTSLLQFRRQIANRYTPGMTPDEMTLQTSDGTYLTGADQTLEELGVVDGTHLEAKKAIPDSGYLKKSQRQNSL